MPHRATLLGIPCSFSGFSLLPLAATLILSGCQLSPSLFDGETNAHVEDPMVTAPPITTGLDAAGLRTLLTAELAGQRGDYRYAGQGLEAAQRYTSPGWPNRPRAARFGNDAALMEAAALRWRELDPRAETPNRLLASLSLQRGDWLDSLEQRLAIAESGGNGEIAPFAEIAVAEEAPLNLLAQQLRSYLSQPEVSKREFHSDVLLGTALIEAALGETQTAQRYLDEVEQQEPESAALWLAKARLALETGDHRGAQQAAQQGLSLAPDDVRFILMLAQAEIRLNNITAAEVQTNALLESHGGNQDLRIALAQLYLEEGHSEPAYRLLQPLISQENIPNIAYFLLGAIAQSQGEVDNALLYYRQVYEGDEFSRQVGGGSQLVRMIVY